MAINKKIIVQGASASSGGGTAGALTLELDASNVDSYDGVGDVWNDIHNFEFTPTTDVSQHFSTVTFNGNGVNGASTEVTGVGFKPDLVWLKVRNQSYHHRLTDSVRGVDKALRSNTSGVEVPADDYATLSFNDDGFNYRDYSQANAEIVAWCFKAGGTAVSNTDGDIDSNVSVNNDLGFSIVGYTGNSSFGQTVGHGLDAIPEMIIYKNRDDIRDWRTYSNFLGATKQLELNSNTPVATYGSFGNTEPTPSVFSTSDNINDRATNHNGDDYIAYCFTSKRGVSKVGSYIGIGDDMTVNVGFEPAFVLIKNSSSAASWHIFDNKRTAANPSTAAIYPNELVNTEADYDGVFEFTSTGFRNEIASTSLNASGDRYIYYAVAKNINETSLIPDTDLILSLDASTYSGSGDWLDSSSNSYSGAITDATWQQELGNHFDFDGSGDKISIPMNMSGAASIEGWFNLDYLEQNGAIATKYGLAPLARTFAWFLTGNNNVRFANYYNSSGHANAVNFDISKYCSPNKWHHAVHTFGPNNRPTVYIDGTAVTELSQFDTAAQNIAHSQPSVPLVLGDFHNGNLGAYDLEGSIAQFRVYDEVLTASQVRQNYNFTKPSFPNQYHSTSNTLVTQWDAGGFFSFDNETISINDAIVPVFDRPNRTLSVWLAVGSNSGYSVPVILQGSDLDFGSIYIQINHNKAKIKYQMGYGFVEVVYPSLASWSHYAIVQDATSSECFLNGVSVGTSTSFRNNTFAGTQFQLGGDATNVNLGYLGDINKLKLFTETLSSEAILSLYNEGH